MPRLVIEVRTSGPGLAGIKERSEDLSEPLEQARQAWLALGDEEFSVAAWRPPSGPLRPWSPVRAALGGARRPLGGAGGSLATSYRRGYVRRGRKSIEFGSDLPYAHVHRGGSGEVTASDSRVPFRLTMTAKQRAFLAIKFREENPGASYGRDRSDPDRGQIITPRRPHFTQSPELATRVNAIFSAWMGGRPIPTRLTEGAVA